MSGVSDWPAGGGLQPWRSARQSRLRSAGIAAPGGLLRSAPAHSQLRGTRWCHCAGFCPISTALLIHITPEVCLSDSRPAIQAGPAQNRSSRAPQDPVLHHVLSFLPSNDVVRLRGVSRVLRDAVHRLPGGLFVKLSISLPNSRSSQRRANRPWAAASCGTIAASSRRHYHSQRILPGIQLPTWSQLGTPRRHELPY